MRTNLSKFCVLPSKLIPVIISVALVAMILCSCGTNDGSDLFGQPLARLDVSEGLSFNFGYVPLGTSSEHTFVITNGGDRVAEQITGSFLQTAFTYFGGSFPGDGGDCADTLEPLATCTIVVSFAPIFQTSYQLPLRVQYFNGATTVFTERPILSGMALPAP